MKTIGLTGGIGSGKSSVASIFESLTIPVFYADESGRKVLESDATVVQEVKQLIGDEAYDASGKANRALIASIVFKHQTTLDKLNKIIHPAVARDFRDWRNALPEGLSYCIREVAILFETGSNKGCDAVVCVSASSEIRIERVMKRDGVSQKDVEARMAKQMPQEEKNKLSDFVIQNSGSESLIAQVMTIHFQLED